MNMFRLITTFALVWLKSMIIGNCLEVRCLESERLALFKFKNQLIDRDGRLSSWTRQKDCCEWEGVHCHNQSNHVTRLHLSDGSLEGNISLSLLELHHLNLDLSINRFCDAHIPDFIGSLTKLRYLNLSYNSFGGGQIPHTISNLSKLLYLDLGFNQGYSENLDWLFSLHSLRYLSLNYVNLSTATNWLQAISKLNFIEELHLMWCYLPDVIPFSLPYSNASTPLAILNLSYNNLTLISTFPWFSNLSNVFSHVDLSYNNFFGPIPDVFKDMKSLSYLDLYYCGIEGGLPKSLGNISTLIWLDLNTNGLTAHLSEIMMNISPNRLQHLDLSSNSITGPFPNFSRFSLLKELDLRHNLLNGPIPRGYLQLANLVDLSLASNRIIGPIPDFSPCSSLRNLYLDHNMFNGTLAETIGSMSMVEALLLGWNQLEGIITENHLTNFSRLYYLDLSYNSLLSMRCSSLWIPPFQLKHLVLAHCKLGPEFPKWIRNHKQLDHLDISGAQIVDTIPEWFGNQALSLAYLNVSDNQIYGFFPDISSSIVYITALDLSRNKISGSLTFLCGMSATAVLIDVSGNLFTSQLPDCFANFNDLKYLNFANNSFTGEIPNSIGSIPSLSFLHLRSNSFSGRFPVSMMNCTKLRMIDIGENRFIGEIPTWIGDKLSELGVLSLHRNEFYGTIPSNLCDLGNLRILDLSSNNLSGVIPKCLQNLTTMARKDESREANSYLYYDHSDMSDLVDMFDGVNLMWKRSRIEFKIGLVRVKLIDLSSNNLVGEIPSEITELVNLVALNLSRNKLTGSIPEDIDKMKTLDFLDLSRNHLSGYIPTSLSELNNLGILNLSYNNLSGRIPQEGHMLTFDEASFTGNPGLCGKPLVKPCPGDETDPRGPENTTGDKDNDSNDKFITKGFYIALGIGFVMAFWVTFGTILFNRSSRHAYFRALKRGEDYVYVRVKLMKARLRRTPQNE